MLALAKLLFLVLLLAFSNPSPVWDTIPRRQNAVVNREMVFRIRLFLFRGLCTGRSGDFTHESSPEACGRVCARDRPVDDVFVCLYMTHYNRMLLLWLPSQTSPSSLVLGMRLAATGATTCSVTAPWRGSATCSRAATPSTPARTPSPRGGSRGGPQPTGTLSQCFSEIEYEFVKS